MLFLLSFGLNGQIAITIRGGGLVDMYRIEQSENDGPFAPWTKGITKGKPWDFSYLNLELAYRFNDKNAIGFRYHFEELFNQICACSYGGIACWQSNNDNISKVSSIYKRIIPLSKKISFQPSIGFGISYSFTERYLDAKSKLVGSGDGILNEIYYDDFDYMDHRVIPFIPLELNLNFEFNDFLNFELNFGYNQYLRKSIIRTEVFKKDSEVPVATIYTSNNMYMGLGIGYHFNFKHKS